MSGASTRFDSSGVLLNTLARWKRSCRAHPSWLQHETLLQEQENDSSIQAELGLHF
jgi:hypothetical protein